MNIEEVAEHTPEMIYREPFDVDAGLYPLPGPQAGGPAWG